jgi:hypothetical protein
MLFSWEVALNPRIMAHHIIWAYGHARLACPRAAFHVLVQWHGIRPHASGFVSVFIVNFNI